MRWTAGVAVALAAVLTVVFSTVASANSGEVAASEDCQTWSAAVLLHNNVAPAYLVTVTSSIPGTTGLSGNYDTRGKPGDTVIWQVAGKSPIAGTVTLTISLNGVTHFTRSASIAPPDHCGPSPSPSPTATPTPAPTPESTPTPVALPPGGGRG